MAGWMERFGLKRGRGDGESVEPKKNIGERGEAAQKSRRGVVPPFDKYAITQEGPGIFKYRRLTN